ncbi:stalk domain-containing protein [Marinicrinis lubricantis]|uniref:Stalk domain-containing protein n=1 Tax=Marinicrinis lubricantis TaxID=2086470 RepID=A0ABW1ITY5_9BACL
MKKKAVMFISAAAMSVGLIAGATAAPVLEDIKAQLNWSTQFKVDGKAWTPEDAEGNKLAPIVYDHTTYLPVRAVSEALDTAVKWDPETQTVILGEDTKQVQIMNEKYKLNNTSVMATKDKQYTVQDGTDYASGFVIENIDSVRKSVTLQPSGQYQKVNLTIYSLDQPEKEVDVKIIDDQDAVLKHVKLNSSEPSATFELEIGGAQEITVEAHSSLTAEERIFVAGYYH